MVINEKELLIVQYNESKGIWEDCTKRVQWYDRQDNACRIKYVGSNTLYWKSYRDIRFFDNPKKIDLNNRLVYCNDEIVFGVKELLIFGVYAKLFYKSGYSKVVNKNSIQIVRDLTNDTYIARFIAYLKEIAVLMPTDDEYNFLLNQLEKITVLENSVLGKFLHGKLTRNSFKDVLLFPFATNAAQRIAVQRAMEEDLSIIQGPPGTGKTETIRNIVANYIARGGSVAVVSGNNEATRNVKDKFESTGFGYLNAFLGNAKNVEAFFEKPTQEVKYQKNISAGNSEYRLRETSESVRIFLQYSLDIAKIEQSILEYEAEKEINDAEYNTKERVIPRAILTKKYSSTQTLTLASILETLPEKKLKGLFNRVRLFFQFGLLNINEIVEHRNDIIEYLKNKYYVLKIAELKAEKALKQQFIDNNNFEKLLVEQKDLSLRVFEALLQMRYNDLGAVQFSLKDYKQRFQVFTKRYPIIYSTTHAIKSCSGDHYLYDCVIIDESSQVDLISAVIAFSVAKKVVLVGDEKQLPHVVQSQMIPFLNRLFMQYEMEDCFNYAQNSILRCALKKYKNITSTLLNEHYRCDPQIIGFCNKRFYNNELVVRTAHEEGNGVTIISHGSHFERERSNEREVDIISKELTPLLPAEDTGIIAPYNNQIDLLRERFGALGYTIDTIHKFQGKEKSNIILSTVANKIKFYEDEERIDFLNNPNLINVAISRAKKRLYILASEEVLNQEGSILRDLLKYYQYYCSETKVLKTNVYSVFDLMYDDYSPILENTKKKLLNISKFTSENIIATIIGEICATGECGALSCKFNYPLKYIIKTDTLNDLEDVKFVSNMHTHCDFLIYNKLNKEIELVVEVDGSQHKEEIQAARDSRKDRLLKEAGIKILRLSTTTIECREKIVQMLKEGRN